MRIRVVVQQGSERGSIIAYAPDFPGCSGVGQSEKEALRAVRRAVTSYLKEQASPLDADARQVYIEI